MHWKTAKGKTVPQKKAHAVIDGKIWKDMCQDNLKIGLPALTAWQGFTPSCKERVEQSTEALQIHLFCWKDILLQNRTQNRHRLTG